MRSRNLPSTLLLLAGLVFLLLAFTPPRRNDAYLLLGIAFVIIGAAVARQTRRR